MIRNMKKKPLKIISLFAGAGGMDLGFKNAGFDIMWANDFDPDSVKTYRRNFKCYRETIEVFEIRCKLGV